MYKRQGENRFQCFDFESVKWLQLHITAPAAGTVRVSGTGLLRRSYPYESAPEIAVKEPALQRLFDAGINTLRNAAIETLVDGMGRERQQYAGDCSHALIPLRGLLGNTRLSKRFIETYSDGLISRGYFLDCYPGIDRLKRIPYKQIGLSYWGPIIDHSVGYVGDIYRYVMETGDVDTLRLVYPKLKTFVDFLIREADGGVQFDSPACGTVSLSFDHAAQNGAPLQPKAFPLIENSFVYSQYGSGIHQLPDRILNFSD